MVDIAVCDRRDCPKKDTCFRYLAERDEYRQSKLDINSLSDNYTLLNELDICPNFEDSVIEL